MFNKTKATQKNVWTFRFDIYTLTDFNLDQFPFLVRKVHISNVLSKSKYWKQFFSKENHNYQFWFINKIKLEVETNLL